MKMVQNPSFFLTAIYFLDIKAAHFNPTFASTWSTIASGNNNDLNDNHQPDSSIADFNLPWPNFSVCS